MCNLAGVLGSLLLSVLLLDLHGQLLRWMPRTWTWLRMSTKHLVFALYPTSSPTDDSKLPPNETEESIGSEPSPEKHIMQGLLASLAPTLNVLPFTDVSSKTNVKTTNENTPKKPKSNSQTLESPQTKSQKWHDELVLLISGATTYESLGYDTQSFLTRLTITLRHGIRLGHPREDDPQIICGVRRLYFKISMATLQLDTSVSIHGVKLLNPEVRHCGSTADVYKGTWEGRFVAIKRLRAYTTYEVLSVQKSLMREALVWQHLDHPNVLPFLGLDAERFEDSGAIFGMVAPWMKSTVLTFALNDPSVYELERIIREAASGLCYLHSQGVVHGDIKSANVLLDEENHAYLADFGLGGFVDATVQVNPTTRGSPSFMAPELLVGDSDFRRTRATDVYSFACLCVEMFTGSPPFSHGNPVLLVMQGHRPTRPDGVRSGLAMGDRLWSTLEPCFDSSPEKRPTAAALFHAMDIDL